MKKLILAAIVTVLLATGAYAAPAPGLNLDGWNGLSWGVAKEAVLRAYPKAQRGDSTVGPGGPALILPSYKRNGIIYQVSFFFTSGHLTSVVMTPVGRLSYEETKEIARALQRSHGGVANFDVDHGVQKAFFSASNSVGSVYFQSMGDEEERAAYIKYTAAGSNASSVP